MASSEDGGRLRSGPRPRVRGARVLDARLRRRRRAPRSIADWVGEVAFFAVYAAPSGLALLGLRGRYGALLSASVLSVLLSWTAFSGVTLVLLVPAAAYAVAFVRLGGLDGARSPLWSLVAVAAGYAAFWALFARDDPYCWEYVVYADGTTTFATVPEQEAMRGHTIGATVREAGGGCDDRITPLESIASLSLVGLAIATTRVAVPRRGLRT